MFLIVSKKKLDLSSYLDVTEFHWYLLCTERKLSKHWKLPYEPHKGVTAYPPGPPTVLTPTMYVYIAYGFFTCGACVNKTIRLLRGILFRL